MHYALGIDLGGSSVKAVVVRPEGEVLKRDQFDFGPGERLAWAEKIREFVGRIEIEEGTAAEWIGLSAPGLAAADNLSIAHMPGRLHGLEGLNWTDYLQAQKPVPVLNDGHAALLGEAWLGAARGFQNAVMLTLGTGVGGAAIVDGRLLRGQIGRAGHLGHTCLDPEAGPDICGTPGSLELAIGNCTISQRSRHRFGSTRELVGAHLSGDTDATEIWLESVRYLACAICSLANILDPEAVILGGGIARAGPALFDPLTKFLDPMEWRPGGHKIKLLPAQLGEFAGAFGSAAHALRQEPTEPAPNPSPLQG